MVTGIIMDGFECGSGQLEGKWRWIAEWEEIYVNQGVMNFRHVLTVCSFLLRPYCQSSPVLSSPVPAYAISPTTNGDCSTTSHPSTREEADGRTVSILLRKYLSIHREGAERWWWWCIEGWSGMPNERQRRRGWTSVWLTNPVVVQWKRVFRGYISASVVGQKVHFQSGYPLFRVTQRNLRNNNSSP